MIWLSYSPTYYRCIRGDLFLGVVFVLLWLYWYWILWVLWCFCLYTSGLFYSLIVIVVSEVALKNMGESTAIKRITMTLTNSHFWWWCRNMPSKINQNHYNDVIMGAKASQITSLTIVYSIVCSDADQRKHQSSALLAFVWVIHRGRCIPRTNGQLRRKCLHFMTSSCTTQYNKAPTVCMSLVHFIHSGLLH